MKISSLKYHLPTILLICFFTLVPTLSFAQEFGLQNPIGVDSISGLIRIIVKVIRYIAIPFVVIMIMYAGFLYLYASYSANGKDLENAHTSIRWVIIGSFVILSAELIAIVVENTLKTLGN